MLELGRWREALLIDLDPANAAALVPCLETLGFHCSHAAREVSFDLGRFDLVFVDGAHAAPIANAAAVVRIVDASADEARYPSAVGWADWADWIDLPIRPFVVRSVIERVLARCALEQRIAELTRQLELELPAPTLISQSGAMRRLLAGASRWARDHRPLLLCGQRGVGRGIVARHIAAMRGLGVHESSGERLSRSDSAEQLQRAVEIVGRGTLIVRDVEQASDETQLALAALLREGAHAKVLMTAAATTELRRELRPLLRDRELVVPSLRERSGDLELLARHFLAHYAPGAQLTRAALAALAAYGWPGEVAELRLAIETAGLRSRGEIEVRHLPERLIASPDDRRYVGGEFTLAELEWAHVSTVLASGRSLQEVAHILGIDNSTLWRLRKRHAHG